MIINNIKNLIPYLLLIAIYFFFINLEATKDKNNIHSSQQNKIITHDKPSFDDTNLRIKIPVIPYNK
tara:strand:- start:756 stop:956 length:201 start_codon:yes stop_codon:yes gene_type:complete